MRLSRRLSTLADHVVPGRPVADIGTDHGLLAAHLVASKATPRVIATDIGAMPLAKARRTVAHVGAAVELRRGDGLQVIAPDEVSTVVIAGMGGTRIRSIVEAAPDIVAGLDRLILQPTTSWATTRAWIARRAWTLVDEFLLHEAGEHHLVLVIDPHPDPLAAPWTDDDIELGPALRRRREPTWRNWLHWQLDVATRALEQAAGGLPSGDAHLERLRARVDRLRRAACRGEPGRVSVPRVGTGTRCKS